MSNDEMLDVLDAPNDGDAANKVHIVFTDGTPAAAAFIKCFVQQVKGAPKVKSIADLVAFQKEKKRKGFAQKYANGLFLRMAKKYQG